MKKIFMILLLICPFFINACSCDKYDINTYNDAVNNYKNSIGLDYKLTITTIISDEDIYTLEESYHKYHFSTIREVENYASEMKKYEIIKDASGLESAPQLVYELKQYYVGEENNFYTNERTIFDNKKVENKTYEEKFYDEKSIYNVNNIVPTFNSDFINNFSIVKDENNKKSSIATFDAACPSTAVCSVDYIKYTVNINRDSYFTKISFTTINEIGENENKKTISTNYVYEFYNYNSDVEIIFPGDLVNY